MFRCPHCKAELPEQAAFCAACGRRVEGWNVPTDATPAAGEPALTGGDEATRQMEPTPSLLRAAAVSVKKGQSRSQLPLVIGMLVVAVAGGIGGFFLVRARLRVNRTREQPPLVAVVPTATGPMVMTAKPPPAEVAPPPPPPTQMLVRKSKTGKRAHVIASVPVPVAAPKPSARPHHVKGGGGGLPHKSVATDSQSLAAQQKQAQSSAPLAMPTVEHETSEAPPTTEAEQKQEAEAQLDGDSVRLVVRQHLPQVRSCHARAFKDASPGGTVEIGFAIDGEGRAKNVRTETNTTDSEPLARCLEERVKEWQFPRPVGGDYELIYPFVFAPGS